MTANTVMQGRRLTVPLSFSLAFLDYTAITYQGGTGPYFSMYTLFTLLD